MTSFPWDNKCYPMEMTSFSLDNTVIQWKGRHIHGIIHLSRSYAWNITFIPLHNHGINVYYSTVIIEQYWRNKMQNNDLTAVFYKLNVKTLKRIRQVQMLFYIHTFANNLRLFIIVQSISRIFFSWLITFHPLLPLL